jgi:thiamine kinase-like enzyme
LARVHALEPPAISVLPRPEPLGRAARTDTAVAPFALELLLQQHAARAVEANPGDAAHLLGLVRRAESILEAMSAAAARKPCIIHNDLYHSNIIATGHRLLLVDWEYAAVTDPLYDLGCLLAYYPRSAPHAARLLESSGLAVRSTVADLTEIAWVYVLLSYLWYRTRSLLAPASAVDRETERALRRRLGT